MLDRLLRAELLHTREAIEMVRNICNSAKHKNPLADILRALESISTRIRRDTEVAKAAELLKASSLDDPLKEALSIALQYVPAASNNPGTQAEIDRIYALVKQGTTQTPPSTAQEVARYRWLYRQMENLATTMNRVTEFTVAQIDEAIVTQKGFDEIT